MSQHGFRSGTLSRQLGRWRRWWQEAPAQRAKYVFGMNAGAISDSLRARVDGIALRHGARLQTVDHPTAGPRYWFECEKEGAPYDQATARAVLRELARFELWRDGEGIVDPTPTDPRYRATLARFGQRVARGGWE